jgi:hypothetical protein
MKKQISTIIKANLTRSALYLLLLLAVCAIPSALAQRSANNRSVTPAPSGAIDVPSIVPPFPKAPHVILYDRCLVRDLHRLSAIQFRSRR